MKTSAERIFQFTLMDSIWQPSDLKSDANIEMIMKTILIIKQNWIHKQETRHPITKDACYQDLLNKPYKIRTYDQKVTGSAPIRYAVLVENKKWESGPGISERVISFHSSHYPEVLDRGDQREGAIRSPDAPSRGQEPREHSNLRPGGEKG